MMKKYIYQILCSLFIGGAMVSCAEDYMETDKGHDTLTLTVNQQEIVLNEKNHTQEALTLSWTTGTNYGSGNRISYTLEIAKAGTDFARAYSVDLGPGTYQWTKKTEELNQFLNTQLGVGYAEKVSLEARITATVAGMEEKEQRATVTLDVTTYQPVTPTLYLIGEAAPNGWSADRATPMERTDNGQFTWTGKLNIGVFKFITTLGEFLPSYNRDAAAGEELRLIYRTSGDEPDAPFTVSKEATYIVKVDLLDLTMTMTETENIGWRFEEFYIVGSFTGDNGWGFEALSKDAVQMNLFHYGAVIPWKADGDFKFATLADFGQSDAFFHPTEGNAPYTSTSVVLGGEDNKWQMKESECGKAYKVLFLTAKGKEKMLMRPFTPYEGLYLVGDATPNGWSIDNATPMAKSADSPYIFTWSGTLNTGEMKISCDKQSDWNGDWLMADKSGKAPTGEVETALFTSKTDAELKNMYPDTDLGSLDNKWNIQEAGSYRITIDQLKETISIVKQ